MKIRLTPILLAALAPVLLSDPAEAQRRRSRTQGGMATWAPDGLHVVYKGKVYDPKTWETVDKAKARPQPGTSGPDMRAAMRAFHEAIDEVRDGEISFRKFRPQATRSTLPRAPVQNPGAALGDAMDAGFASFDGELWSWKKGGKARLVAKGVAGMRHFAVSPSGTTVCYILNNNLYLATADGTPKQLSEDGSENLFYGELDWVYQEEVYGRYDFQAAWLAPAGDHLAFMRTDENGVDTFNVIDHIPNQLGVEQLKYPKAGRTNPRATLHVANTAGKVVTVDLSRYKPEDEILIVRVGWTPKGDRIVYMIQNREQTWLDLNFADPATGASERIIHETCSNGWVERLPMPRWLEDGTFIWESDRTGYRHFYRYRPDGQLIAALSKGPWSADSILTLDEKGGWMGFTGHTETYSIGKHAYYATLDGKTLRQVTKGRGTHRVSFSADGSMVLDAFQHLENAGEQWLRTTDGKDLRKIFAIRTPDGPITKWVQIKARDGETLDVTYTLPANFDESKTYPVWINTYSGPAAPTVRDSFRGPARGTWYIQLAVNVRSASTRGMKFTTQCYKQFGVQELKDIEDTVDWMCKNSWADASRVGITGWSYGGFMTAFALTHSKKFKCGIAGAGVYDWGLYDTIYTERYMMTPQNNPEGYRASSVVAAAKNLHGELLIVHGTMDDNVHLQNAVQLVHELQKAGKLNFQFMLYPKSRHGVRSPHLQGLRMQFMRKNL